jgi:hypothetical protein
MLAMIMAAVAAAEECLQQEVASLSRLYLGLHSTDVQKLGHLQ